MSEQNKALYRAFVDRVMGQKDLSALDDLIADDFVDHNPVPGTEGNKAGMREGMEVFLRAFPDIRSRVDFMVAEGDLVVGHHTTTGTQAEEFLGVPASGKSFRVDEIHIVRIVDGKAVEHWGLADDLNMMQQLGVLEQKV